MAEKLTSREQDYSQWYNEIVQGAGLAENSGVRGCMVIKPYGYARRKVTQKTHYHLVHKSGTSPLAQSTNNVKKGYG